MDSSRRYFSISPVCYTVLYPKLVEVARAKGYALAVHGSMVRDFDLVAIPWTDAAVDALELVLALKEVVRGIFHHEDLDHLVTDGQPSTKPHGRKAWSIHFTNSGCHGPYIDISVMPVIRAAPAATCRRCGGAGWVPSNTDTDTDPCPACGFAGCAHDTRPS